MGSRFVRPDTTTLTLANGDTLTVKTRLNAGEQRAQYARASITGADGELHSNPLESGLALILAYLLDWSLKDDAGTRVVIQQQPIATVQAAIDALDWASFVEIKKAIEVHELAMIAERTAEKNGQDGGTGSSAISPSPSAVTGASSGSGS